MFEEAFFFLWFFRPPHAPGFFLGTDEEYTSQLYLAWEKKNGREALDPTMHSASLLNISRETLGEGRKKQHLGPVTAREKLRLELSTFGRSAIRAVVVCTLLSRML